MKLTIGRKIREIEFDNESAEFLSLFNQGFVVDTCGLLFV